MEWLLAFNELPAHCGELYMHLDICRSRCWRNAHGNLGTQGSAGSLLLLENIADDLGEHDGNSVSVSSLA